VDKGHSQARDTGKSGLLKSWYVYHRLGCITGAGNDVQFNADAFTNWKIMKLITEREAAQSESLVGDQAREKVM